MTQLSNDKYAREDGAHVGMERWKEKHTETSITGEERKCRVLTLSALAQTLQRERGGV